MTTDEQEMLDIVLSVAGDDEKQIIAGIVRALVGTNEPARRTYLWGLLSRKAKERIRAAREKYAHA